MQTDSSSKQVTHLPDRLPAPTARPPREGPQTPALPALSDLLCTTSDPAATGFLLASLPRSNGPVLWVQDFNSRRENGYLYLPGFTPFAVTQPILQVTVSQPRDVLWAMEEGANCAGLSAVIGEIHGAPAALDFTATKRLALRAQSSGVPVFLIRSGDPGVLSAARERWRIASLPSHPHTHDSHAPGPPQWDAELFRARARPPGRWVAHYEHRNARAADRLRLVSRADAGALDPGDQRVPHRSGA